MMRRRERVTSVFDRRPVDRLPTQVNLTDATGARLASLLATSQDSLQEELDNHLLRVEVDTLVPASDGTLWDAWQVGFSGQTEGYLVTHYPLRDSDDGYCWPDFSSATFGKRFDVISRTINAERHGLDRFVIPNQGFALFERAWALHGLEETLTDLYLERSRMEGILEAITERQIELARGYVAAGVDGGYFGDDLGSQQGMLFSPDLWRELFKPRMARMFAVYTDAGLPVIMHSDGNIAQIIPDLIEIGLSCLNPCQPELLSHAWLAREYGRDLAFYGGVSTQKTLPVGSTDDVRAACEAAVRDLAPNATGLLFGPSHRLMNDIPDENLLALVDYVREVRTTHA